METTTTSDALLAAILDRPHDDAPRLIYADWLEERDGPGDAERAEFVRVQCRINEMRLRGAPGIWSNGDPENSEDHPIYFLRRRADELLAEHVREWFGASFWPDGTLRDVTPHDVRYEVRRGFVEEVRTTLETWTGGVCEGCHNSDSHGFAGHGNWRRFECPSCHGTGRVAGVGATLVACQPVTTVRVTDQEPYQPNDYISTWFWYDVKRASVSGIHPESDLPAEVFHLLQGGCQEDGDRLYDTEESAISDLSSALILLAKGGDA